MPPAVFTIVVRGKPEAFATDVQSHPVPRLRQTIVDNRLRSLALTFRLVFGLPRLLLPKCLAVLNGEFLAVPLLLGKDSLLRVATLLHLFALRGGGLHRS